MRVFKSNPILRLVNSYLIDSPQPSNISYLWNFGSLLALCLGIQIITGVTLAMHYNPSVAEAFNSVEHIMRDVNNGWLIRYMHSNTASAFFFLVYLHIGRGIYYGSYKAPRTATWAIGSVILIAMMGTGFLGYEYSPKWYNILFYIIIIILYLLIIYYYKNYFNKLYISKNIHIKFNKRFINKNLFNNSIKRYYYTNSNFNNSSERLDLIIKELKIKSNLYIW